MGEPEIVEHIERAEDTVHALIAGVVVGGAEQVKAGVLRRFRKGVRRAEAGEARIGRSAAEHGLEVRDRVVRLLELLFRVGEHVVVVILAR